MSDPDLPAVAGPPEPGVASEPGARSVALVGFSGASMRYAEVAAGEPPRLLRLGTCDFDLDAEAAVFGPGATPAATMAVLADALRDVFAGTAAQQIVVAVPATASTAFFSLLPAALTADARDEQIRQEAALLADVAPATPLRVRAVPVRAEPADPAGGGARQWVHVLHVGEAVHARIGQLAAALGVGGYDVADGPRAAAAVVQALAPAADVALVVGAYAGHTEVAVVRGGSLLFSHHGPGATPEDTAYFALAALGAAGLDAAAVGCLFAYGDALGDAAAPGVAAPDEAPARLAMIAGLTNAAAVPLDALAPFGQPVGGASPWELSAFAPLLGAALPLAREMLAHETLAHETPARETPAAEALAGGH